ncbi:tail fiber protein [Flavobacterium sharifuzzamanii]|uniref:tail fiber protein n=1 Tax=Flavobacterium sharifuzzamanii TaxID=2211133 RepID=UPI000DAE0263|nr:tail fiber protein [Flavobacterium sharifuzzamanii]KAF2080629.1 hypothetical protein DMA14_10640 [Flavobacterium sharifuzzamanii]
MTKTTFFLAFLSSFVITKASGQISTSLSVVDTRDNNDLPNFSKRDVRADFKLRSVIGVPGSGTYSTSLTFSPWENVENSGEKNHQLNFNNGGVFYRNAYPMDAQWGGWKQLLITDENGNLGIGTNFPMSKLSVYGSVTMGGGVGNNTLPRPLINAGTLPYGEIRGYSGAGDLYDDGFLRLSAGAGTASNVKSFIDLSGYSNVPDMNGNIVFGTYGAERMRIDRNGYVSIGTSAPDALLTVKGTIHSSEVKVDLNFPAPDYVFANDYKLKTLDEVEDYIKGNSHLPEIPSAKEFEKNGINISEMNMALLKKIEELTLYMIEMKKENEKQNQEIKNLKRQLNTKK